MLLYIKGGFMRLDLNGKWRLSGAGAEYTAEVPGCNYLDLLKEGAIPDPFCSLNESRTHWIGDNDWSYQREFEVGEEMLNYKNVELVASSLDTLCKVIINGEEVAYCDNAFRTYRIDILPCLIKGNNTIEILFLSPVEYVKKQNAVAPLVKNFMGLTGIQYMRKPAYHFGWDWGPALPLSGIIGDIYIDAYSARIGNVHIKQSHNMGKVTLNTLIEVKGVGDGRLVQYIESPQGAKSKVEAMFDNGKCSIVTVIDNPMLWYPNGMGGQPLYNIEFILYKDDKVLDSVTQIIGLRKIVLSTAPDKYGSDFCFYINGKKLFAKGANWIPSDSFINRTTDEQLDFYIKSAKDANMNMLRVWGGGYYESDKFYELCDFYGILVWQDFAYACYPYPFYDKDFLANALVEAEENIIRLRNHASLALWCGNNEIELMSLLWFYRKKLKVAQKEFFYDKLKESVNEFDGITPYWAGSPSSGEYCVNAGSDDYGDTHLWQVWHGLRRPEYYRGRQSRFVSEFGLEALPTMRAVKSFAESKDYDLNSPVMLAHQKCSGGNGKMLYYLMLQYHIPKYFDDLIYLSGLTQAYAIKKAVLGWRKAGERCNGALYWQYNDCWPVSSWASVDYTGSYKALQYFAKHFYAPVKVYLEKEGDCIDIYCINDNDTLQEVTLKQRILDFYGKEFHNDTMRISLEPNKTTHIGAVVIDDQYKKSRKQTYLLAELYGENGQLLDCERELFVKDKQAAFLESKFSIDIDIVEDKAQLKITSDTFARNVCVDIEGLPSRFSDNYMDIDAGGSACIQIDIPAGWTKEMLMQKLNIKSLNKIERGKSNIGELFKKLSIILYPPNLINAIAQLFN
ncbi:MAG: glycoside hydrolase family 2 protein [Clostridia bacterium]|nr:glycoside hydrolase family 2 protein [Clostridia bacterium]